MDPPPAGVGLLSLFVGLAAADAIAQDLEAAGLDGLRFSHGFLFQHLIEGPRTVAELARLQGVSAQATSKVVAELRDAGYLEDAAGSDARERPVALAARGREAIAVGRQARVSLRRKLRRHLGDEVIDRLEVDLAAVLEVLGGADAVRVRRVRMPS